MADRVATNGNTNGNTHVDGPKASKLGSTDGSASTDAPAALNPLTNGPVAQNVMDQSSKATAEISNLAASRHPPAYTAATGQPLTNYHSFFSELLSWRNPRASAIAYASLVSLIFSVRYLDVLRYTFKLTWMVLAIAVVAEIAGKALFNSGLATQLRPRKYYTIPRETLEAAIGDVHELINFFVIESQRVLFTENVYASVAAAFAAFISYYLVKVVPYWGLAVIATTVVFFTPLIYTTNQELIDTQLKHASEVVNAQTAQLRTVAQKHTEQATQVTKQYMGDYTAKAQALIKGGRSQAEQLQEKVQEKVQEKASAVKATDFPEAPKDDIKPSVNEPIAPEPVVENTFKPVDGVKTDGEPLIAA